MTTLSLPTARRRLTRGPRPVWTITLATTGLLIAAVILELTGRIPSHTVLHALDRLPAPIRQLFMGRAGSHLLDSAAHHR
ncbi:MAG: hypothetical protein JO147_05355 [Actinobacteria bacterium]|nr:hypothetical protein [Actinomycetota bacterium]